MIKSVGVALVLMFCIQTIAVSQDGYRIDKTVYIPERYYVGDRVELRLRISTDDGIQVRTPLEMPAAEWVTFEETMVVPYAGETEIRLVFVPFRPGTRSLPLMVFGDIVLDDVKIHTSSVMAETGSDFAVEKGQVPLPGTQLLLAGVISAGVLLPVLVFLGFSKGKYIIREMRRRYSESIPSRHLGRVLDELIEGERAISHREYYIGLSKAIRDYLSGKSGSDFASLTSDELADEIVQFVPPAGLRAAIMTILRRADGVKFAGWGIDLRTREKDASTAREAAKEIDKLLSSKLKNEGDVHVDV